MMQSEAPMPQTQRKPESIGRSQAINFLRSELLKRMDGNTSACRFAATEGIFCRGFARFDDDELRRRFAWITNRRPNMSRQELEEVADRWQLARQDVDELPIACDVQQREHDMCHGWDDFSNEELSRFCFELTGQNIVVA
jgi:hypothetical protein